MNPTATPVFRPTADCIWNSFLSSGKRHLLLTGSRKAGKSTLLAGLFPDLPPGITTHVEPRQAVLLTENRTGKRARIGIFDPALPGPANRMRPLPEGFAALGIPAIERCLHADGEWACIDEIGYLDSCCGGYIDAVRRLMQKKRLAAALRKQELPFIRELLDRSDAYCVDLDAPYGNTGCVIMASGLGRRFGSNKLMADFHGEPLIRRIIAATEGIFSRRVVVTRHEAVASLCRESGVDVILHNLPYRSDTVRLGLEAVGCTDRCMFCPGDQPLIRRETIASLALSAVNDPASVWRTAFDGVPGSPVLFPQWAFPELLSLPEGKGGGCIAKKYPERVRTVPVRDKYELMDADSPEDLRILAGQ